MFRHERPQKGRYVSSISWAAKFSVCKARISTLTDYAHRPLVARAGYLRARNFELNSIGSLEARANYRDALVHSLSSIKKSWTKTANAACTLPAARAGFKKSGSAGASQRRSALGDYLDEESREHFAGLCKCWRARGSLTPSTSVWCVVWIL